MQPPLSPAKMILATASVFPAGKPPAESTPTWFRLRRTDDGLLCLESIPDEVISRSQSRLSEPEWAFFADVPPHIARQLTDDASPDFVAGVLGRALQALGIV